MSTNEEIQFPDDILLGVGSSSYQIEGGWDADQKTPSIWDDFLHNQKIWLPDIKAKLPSTNKCLEMPTSSYVVNGDVACDSYHKLDEDIKNLVDLGVNVYRFSICWPRVLPDGDDRNPNEAGINFYKNLIQKLSDNNIQPAVTIYHWELPSSLQKLGGWANPNIVEYFKVYATFLFKTFGDQVKIWSTFNEPGLFSQFGYGGSGMPPANGSMFSGIGDYMAVHTILLAHAAAYKIYKDSFKDVQKGQVGICINTLPCIPMDPNSSDDKAACERIHDFVMGIILQPLATGEYPKSVVENVKETNERDNINLQRLPEFTEEQKKDLTGSYDFISFNYYDATKVRALTDEEYDGLVSLSSKDQKAMISPGTGGILEDTAKGFTITFDYVRDICNDPFIFVGENGFEEKPGVDDSEDKIKYFYAMLKELKKNIDNGAKVIGYCVWSFMDSLEWTFGYYTKFYGVLSVDFHDEDRPRSKKPTTWFFEKLFKTKTAPALPQK